MSTVARCKAAVSSLLDDDLQSLRIQFDNLLSQKYIRECGSTLYVGMAQGVSFPLYIGIGAKFENTQKTGERRLPTAEYRTVLL